MTTTTARQFINGELVGSNRQSSSTSPADGSTLGSYADADEAQGKQAIAAARNAFAETDWSRDRRLRHQVLNGIADAIDRRTGDLINLLARENGKLAREAGFELSLTVPKLRYYGALALSESGRAAEVSPGLHMSSVPEPIGVAGVIVPWNSPVVLSVRSFAPALAAGCTAVVKLPGQTGLVNGLLHEILAEVDGLPAGVLNSLTESGNEVASAARSWPTRPRR
jgi:betaine-aldehyde dehydrogenase